MKIGSLATVGLVLVVAYTYLVEFKTCYTHGFAASPQQRPNRPPRPPRRKPSSSDILSDPGSSSSNHTLDDSEGRNSGKSILTRHQQAQQDPFLLTNVTFADQQNEFHPLIFRALTEGMGLERMTQVQARTYRPALEGQSIMATSQTGSGKTLAFLLPSIERLLQQDLDLYRPGRSIGVIVLSPTRELAIQIADQAEQLLRFQTKANSLSVACLYGGVKMQRDVRLLTGSTSSSSGRVPDILVSTPARLLDHLLGNTRLGRGPQDKFVNAVDDTKIVVLDEADQLWHSHRKDTEQILSFLARSNKRQTLLFSATFPRSLRRHLKESILKGQEVHEVDCIDSDSDKKENLLAVSERIQQSFVILDNMALYLPTLLGIIRREQSSSNSRYKIMVFFPTSRLVRFFYQLCTIGNVDLSKSGRMSGETRRETGGNHRDDGDGQKVLWEIHSRMSQASRGRASNAFRNAQRGILFTSDVSARGLDYPDVTLVVQMGAPFKRSQYIHRLGRSGRAGREGRGILVLLPFEARIPTQYDAFGTLTEDKEVKEWLKECSDATSHLQGKRIGPTTSPFVECAEDVELTVAKIKSGHSILTPSADAAVKSFLAHYTLSSNPSVGRRAKGVSPQSDEILEHARELATALGILELPQS